MCEPFVCTQRLLTTQAEVRLLLLLPFLVSLKTLNSKLFILIKSLVHACARHDWIIFLCPLQRYDTESAVDQGLDWIGDISA